MSRERLQVSTSHKTFHRLSKGGFLASPFWKIPRNRKTTQKRDDIEKCLHRQGKRFCRCTTFIGIRVCIAEECVKRLRKMFFLREKYFEKHLMKYFANNFQLT